jgi:hypothetical protein
MLGRVVIKCPVQILRGLSYARLVLQKGREPESPVRVSVYGTKRKCEWRERIIIRTPIFSANVALRADSAAVNNYAQNDETYKARHFDQTENKFD